MLIINFGRLVMLFVWGFLLFNLIHPYPRPLNIFINVAAIFMFFMHGLQAAMLKASLPKESPKMSGWFQLRIFLFGVFELLAWQKAQKKS
ncbi:DUF1145 family protein [Shimwellia blattae]|uniref:Transporter n=1 Tax=Shimwellia blattae (strain ATCC 29907 / DSM 4481 / JCM 1650 / NBRC 105725 / CDC 9005-74) TaxID=630626 RepID=I2B462_SHIBC|nr:DUF1145 family protein [Shimwellia blattae]AFJ45316.1 transporter [Shimwellia blattae DSM 4481 = NBRC 105725]GAB80571.1 hypothetical protein YhhL [Shimwellia blattae DSM 4481 = NBRC 105725]VDY62797.1 Predicted membrane protein [Shimwellia blattae]VEC19651.1 Predicted membrane protein [Shimwellia blattae]